MKIYEEIPYWNKRKHPSVVGGTMAVDYLKATVGNARSVLDFGPGVGRTLCAYRDAKFVCTVDISTMYEDRLRKEAEKYEFAFATYFLTNVVEALTLPFETGSYDFAVVCQVLMHMKPHYVGKVLLELARVAKEVAVITLMHKERPYDAESVKYPQDRYCFNYDMLGMCEELGLAVRDVEFRNKNILFVCSKRR